MFTILFAQGVFADFDEGLASYKKNDYAFALQIFRPLAKQGHANAQFNLGLMLFKAQGVAQDETHALQWFRKAADQNLAAAQVILGNMYEYGQVVKKNDAHAAQWYRKAADQEDANGQFSLAYMYARGQGVTKDDTQALNLYIKSANQGLVAAQSVLGIKYSLGLGVKKDEEQAVRWYRKAADQGDTESQAYLDNLKKRQEYEVLIENITTFQKALKDGDHTNCGLVLETKENLIKIYFPVENYGNEHWIRRDMTFPSSYDCRFVNGQYKLPKLLQTIHYKNF